MKRFWFGIALLAVFLAAGIGSAVGIKQLHSPVGTLLEQASDRAQHQSWPEAAESFRQARALWQQHWHFVAAITDHEPMEQIDALFAQGAQQLRQENPSRFPDTCAQLQSQLQDLIEAQIPSWWNIL